MAKSKNIKSNESISIFSYHEYRNFIKDWLKVNSQSQLGKKVSLRTLAKNSNLSPSLLSMILNEQRPLSKSNIIEISKSMKLNDSESKYFALLCQLSDSPKQEDRIKALDKLKKYKNLPKNTYESLESHNYMSNWYHVAIRELAILPEFQPDPKWIQKRLKRKLPISTIESTLEFLFDKNYLIKDPITHKVKSIDKALNCSDGVYKISLAQFHGQMFEQSIQSIEDTDSSQRWITGHTVALDINQFNLIKDALNETLKTIQKITEIGPQSGEVYHITLAATPLTKKKEK